MIWALDLDDFNDRCGKGKYPLLSAIKNVLASPPSDSDMMTNPPPEGEYNDCLFKCFFFSRDVTSCFVQSVNIYLYDTLCIFIA